MNKNANYSIALKVRKVLPNEQIDESCSKFFGKPCFSDYMVQNYPEDCIFFAQINCKELKDLDTDNRLPHNGYLYFFLDEDNDQMYVMHDENELTTVIDDFNSISSYNGFDISYIINFEKADEYYDSTKLLGSPSNYVDEYDDKPGLLLQYDPYEFNIEYLSTLDGYAFIFFDKNNNKKFDRVMYVIEGS